MTTIRNTNEQYGMPVEFEGETLEAAVADMQATIRECPELAGAVVTEEDYEIVEDEDRHAITSATIYWDTQVTGDECWGYRVYNGDRIVESGRVDVDADAPIQGAIDEIIRYWELPENAEFALTSEDGGAAFWQAD